MQVITRSCMILCNSSCQKSKNKICEWFIKDRKLRFENVLSALLGKVNNYYETSNAIYFGRVVFKAIILVQSNHIVVQYLDR